MSLLEEIARNKIPALPICEACANQADVVIRPEFGECGLFEDGRGVEVYEAGRRAAKEAIPVIKEHLERLANTQDYWPPAAG